MRIVIVGNGVAGVEAALAVREREPGWEITLVSEESDHFFSRTAMMYVLSGQMAHRDLEPHERDLYARKRFVRVRARATGLDVERRLLFLGGSLEPLRWDRLLLACGSRARQTPFWPGSDLRGVGHFVTLQDLEWLERELHAGPSHGGRPPRADAHHGSSDPSSAYWPRASAAESRGSVARSPVVIGGGLIGVEVVETMVAAGLRPVFLIREEWFWPMAIDSRESSWIAEKMRDHGVDVRLEHNVEGFMGDHGNVSAVRTDQGELPSDLVVIAVGVVPNTDWLKATPIGRDRVGGILVDDGLATNIEGVFAAGDCATVTWFDGSRRPQQLWYTSRDQGRVAGHSILGDSVSYRRPTWYNSAKLMDVEYTSAGQLEGEGLRDWYWEEQGPVRSTTRIAVDADYVVGFNLLGRRWDHTVLVRWIEERRPLPWVLARLSEASFDTEFVPPVRIPRALLDEPAQAMRR